MVKNNFRNNYKNTNISCPLCHKTDDTQEHLFVCEMLMHRDTSDECVYEQIFSQDNEELLKVAQELKEIVELRESLLNPER